MTNPMNCGLLHIFPEIREKKNVSVYNYAWKFDTVCGEMQGKKICLSFSYTPTYGECLSTVGPPDALRDETWFVSPNPNRHHAGLRTSIGPVRLPYVYNGMFKRRAGAHLQQCD
jgi:hypothetical protein